MKKFSNVKNTLVPNKYQNKMKNDIYSIIKENISVNINPSYNNVTMDDVNIDLNGTGDLVEKINSYIRSQVIKERSNVLRSIRTSIATGTLDIKKINEEIETCECSELCAVDTPYQEETEVQVQQETESEYEDDSFFDEYEDDKTEYVSITGDNDVDVDELSDDFIDMVDEGNISNLNWGQFFDNHNIPTDKRSKLLVNNIYSDIERKRPGLLN